jgi:hypothetical protein
MVRALDGWHKRSSTHGERDVMALWFNPRQPKLSQCVRKVLAVYRRDGIDVAGYPGPADFRHYIKTHVSDTMIERYRGGAKQYADTVGGFAKRRWDEAVGDVFCSDHRLVDFWARVPDPERPGEFKAARLYCSTVEDLKSRYRVVSLLYADQHPNHRIVAEILWNAIKANGGCPPKVFYIDNGKDFLKQGLTTPVLLRTSKGDPLVDPRTGRQFEHYVCRELGTEIKLSRGYNGREKPVEGSFGIDATLHDRDQVGFTGNTTVQRARMDGEHYDGDILRLPSVEQARQEYARHLDEFHNLSTQSKICPARTRAEAWLTMRAPTRSPLTPAQLDMAFLLPLGPRRLYLSNHTWLLAHRIFS